MTIKELFHYHPNAKEDRRLAILFIALLIAINFSSAIVKTFPAASLEEILVRFGAGFATFDLGFLKVFGKFFLIPSAVSVAVYYLTRWLREKKNYTLFFWTYAAVIALSFIVMVIGNVAKHDLFSRFSNEHYLNPTTLAAVEKRSYNEYRYLAERNHCKGFEVFVFDMMSERWGRDAVVVMAIKDEGTVHLSREAVSRMRKLRLPFDLNHQYRRSFYLVVKGKKLIKAVLGLKKLTYKTTIDKTALEVVSAGYTCGNQAHIYVNGKDFSANQRGMNCVVFDPKSGKVLYTLHYDTFAKK